MPHGAIRLRHFQNKRAIFADGVEHQQTIRVAMADDENSLAPVCGNERVPRACDAGVHGREPLAARELRVPRGIVPPALRVSDRSRSTRPERGR